LTEISIDVRNFQFVLIFFFVNVNKNVIFIPIRFENVIQGSSVGLTGIKKYIYRFEHFRNQFVTTHFSNRSEKIGDQFQSSFSE